MTDKQRKLLEKAMSSTANAAKERVKLRLPNLLKEQNQYSVGGFWLLMFKSQKSKVLYCKEDIHLVTVNFDIDSVCEKKIYIYCRLSFSQS